MGNWQISIEGHGIHHNRGDNDADQLAADLVQRLREAGHYITRASFTAGSATRLGPEAADDDRAPALAIPAGDV